MQLSVLRYFMTKIVINALSKEKKGDFSLLIIKDVIRNSYYRNLTICNTRETFVIHMFYYQSIIV
jgi:hypothetical protein